MQEDGAGGPDPPSPGASRSGHPAEARRLNEMISNQRLWAGSPGPGPGPGISQKAQGRKATNPKTLHRC